MLAPRNFSDLITFTRASSATRFNASGVLETVGNNVARLDFDPVTLAARGLLVEEQRTNSIRNNTMQGVATGSPGTTPTNWIMSGSGNGITRTIVNTGTDDGITFIEVRWSGTAVAAADITIVHEPNNQIVAAQNQTWTYSSFLVLAAGSFSNLSRSFIINQHDASGNWLAPSALVATNFPAGGPTGGAIRAQRYYYTGTLNNASVARVQGVLYMGYSAGAVIDISLRIGLPQLEQGAFATSPIPTTNAAVTRNADAASVNTLSPWFNAAAGTLYVEFAVAGYGPTNAYPVAATLSDGTGSYRITVASTNIGVNNNLYAYGEVVAAGGLQAGFYGATGSEFGVGATRKTATAYATNDFAFTTQGLTPQVDASGVVPLFLNRLDLGAFFNSSQPINGWLRRLAYYPRRLINAELQALTT